MSWSRAVASYPPTWLVVALTAGATMAAWVWFSPGIVQALVLAAVVGGALLTWPVAMAVSGTTRRLRRRDDERRDAVVDPVPALRRDLATLPDPRPLQQLDAVVSKGENLTAVLGRRLDAGEMTYARYLTAGRQVVSAVVTNLSEVSLAFESIRTIDAPGVDRRLRELQSAHGGPAERERQTLTARLELWRAQQERINGLLADNEAAMTALAATATAISRTPMGTSATDSDAATAELESLAARASRYAADGRAEPAPPPLSPPDERGDHRALGA